MNCAAHPDIEARVRCAACEAGLCDACVPYELDALPCCLTCGRRAEDDDAALASGLLALVAVGYLAALAIGIVLFRARPFVGGVAAIVAIALGRTAQLLVKGSRVTRRADASGAGSASTSRRT